MADTVTSQVIVNGNRNLVMKFTNLSDGTGESAVKKVDAQSATFATTSGNVPGTHLTINKVYYDLKTMSLRILWDNTIDTDALILGGFGTFDFNSFKGLTNPLNAGATGSILFTTVGAAANASYTVVLEMIKNVA